MTIFTLLKHPVPEFWVDVEIDRYPTEIVKEFKKQSSPIYTEWMSRFMEHQREPIHLRTKNALEWLHEIEYEYRVLLLKIVMEYED